MRKQIGRPFWIDTVGKSALVEIRIQLDDAVMRVFARRSAAYASNAQIFLLWMVGTSGVLLIVAIIFLRNQIKPILRLADAAESFGMGREVPNFRPRGAREVRRAAAAFIEMKTRIERSLEQRTAMLAGVSHDLRTVLTRFKLELALIGDSPEVEAMKKDIDEMARMLEAYLAFARGDAGEQSAPTDMAAFLEELKLDAERHGHKASVVFHGPPIVTVRPAAFKRCLGNLVSNAARFGPPSPSPATATTAGSASPSTTTAPASRRTCARTCSSRSFGSTTRATRTWRHRLGAGHRPRHRTRMAARSCSGLPLGGFGPRSACRCNNRRHFLGQREALDPEARCKFGADSSCIPGSRASLRPGMTGRFKPPPPLPRRFPRTPAPPARAAADRGGNAAQVADETVPALRARQPSVERGHGAVERGHPRH